MRRKAKYFIYFLVELLFSCPLAASDFFPDFFQIFDGLEHGDWSTYSTLPLLEKQNDRC